MHNKIPFTSGAMCVAIADHLDCLSHFDNVALVLLRIFASDSGPSPIRHVLLLEALSYGPSLLVTCI